MKKIVLGLLSFIFIFLMIPINVNAAYDWRMDKMDVDIIVDEDRTLHITETIDAYFNISKHGIYRKIPLENNVKRNDGTETKVFAKISKIKCSDNFTTETEDGNKVIKIGSSSKTLTGSKKYVISYDYKLTDDRLEDEDEFYFNIVGTEWEASIGRVDFKITMPKDFDEDKMGFSTGSYGYSGYVEDDLIFDVDGKTIEGHYLKQLNPYQGITIRMTLDKDYFIKENYNSVNIVVIIVSILGMGISYIVWRNKGKDKRVVETVEFNPPKGLNSAETGYYFYGHAKNEGVVSLLIYLANKGYIKIKEIETEGLFSKSKDYEIIKVKPYDGTNEIEQEFMAGLFKKGDTVTKKDLENKFYTTVNKINNKLSKKENRDKIYEKTPFLSYILLFFISLIIFAAMSYRIYLVTYSVDMILGGGIFLLMGLIFLSIGISKYKYEKTTKYVLLFIGIIFTGVNFLMMAVTTLSYDSFAMIIYLLGVFSILIVTILMINLDRRTLYGNEMLGKIGGFKNFLMKAEKEKLERLVEKDPKYFYNILPFTYALGVSTKWIKKFESITFEQPDWYVGNSAFNYYMFANMMNNTMTTMKTSMTSSPSSSGGGSGFSGGGFSGGGSGGGGGGSW